MANYGTITTRGSAGGSNLVPVEQAAEIISAIPAKSAALSMFRHIPMGRYQERVPVLSVLPQAYWVTGEAGPSFSGLKQTTSVAWEGRILQAEEIACIVPIPEQLLADSEYDIWGEITPLVAAEIGRQLDAAVFFGINAPASFGTAIVPAAIAAGNVVTDGTAAASAGGLAADIANLFAFPENDGFEVDGAVARTTLRAKVRNARMTTGQELTEIQTDEWYGQPVMYALRGLWPTGTGTFTADTTSGSAALANVSAETGVGVGDVVTGSGIPTNTTIIALPTSTTATLSKNATATATGVTITPVAPEAVVGDFSQGLLGVRQDITYKVLDQAVLTDNTGAVQLNLAQQDAVALRVVARFAYQTANVVTYDQPTEASRWPWATLLA